MLPNNTAVIRVASDTGKTREILSVPLDTLTKVETPPATKVTDAKNRARAKTGTKVEVTPDPATKQKVKKTVDDALGTVTADPEKYPYIPQRQPVYPKLNTNTRKHNSIYNRIYKQLAAGVASAPEDIDARKIVEQELIDNFLVRSPDLNEQQAKIAQRLITELGENVTDTDAYKAAKELVDAGVRASIKDGTTTFSVRVGTRNAYFGNIKAEEAFTRGFVTVDKDGGKLRIVRNPEDEFVTLYYGGSSADEGLTATGDIMPNRLLVADREVAENIAKYSC